MTGYKKIIENMVECEVNCYVTKCHGGYVPYPDKVTLELDKEVGSPSFTAEITVSDRDYVVAGYVNDYGTVLVCAVRFERDLVIDKDRDDWWARDNIRHTSECLWGDKLKGFKFDR